MSSSSVPPFSYAPLVYTQPPNPDWKYGEPVTTTEQGREWMKGLENGGLKTLDVSEESSRTIYQLMKSTIIPRPIAFISSTSEDGIDNLAPFSFFNMVAPGVIGFSASRNPRLKDTALNVQSKHGFVVNLISEPWLQQAHAGSISAPEGVSEWGFSGLTKVPSIHVKPPRVKESAFAMECEFLFEYPLTDPRTDTPLGSYFLASVKKIHVRNDILNDRGYVDPTKFIPVARVGDISYARISELYQVVSGSWEEESQKIPEELKKDLREKL